MITGDCLSIAFEVEAEVEGDIQRARALRCAMLSTAIVRWSDHALSPWEPKHE